MLLKILLFIPLMLAAASGTSCSLDDAGCLTCGTAAETTAECNGNCCVGEGACTWADSVIVTVCPGGCNGASACMFHPGFPKFIGENSCNGQEACKFVDGIIEHNSCNGYQACLNAEGDIGSGSCNSDVSCNYAKFTGDCVAECIAGAACPDAGVYDVIADNCSTFPPTPTPSVAPTMISCDDQNMCTTDLVVDGVCTFEPITCDDSDPNTFDSCDPVIGCIHECQSPNLCIDASFNEDGTCLHEPRVCDDGDENTIDTCDPESGCIHLCQSPDLCTGATINLEGQCTFEALTCDDGNDETTDSCDPSIGCVHTCESDDLCLIASQLEDGTCDFEMVECDDGNILTVDTCVSHLGCQYIEIGDDLSSFDAIHPADDDETSMTIFYEDETSLSTADESALLNWIKAEVTQLRSPFCYKKSYGRGAGTVITHCPDGKERIGALCYTPCPAGYKRFGFDCHQTCKEGWKDDGLFCRMKEYGRGVGFRWKFGDSIRRPHEGMKRRCKEEHGECEMWGSVCYPKCKKGYTPSGCCICRPKFSSCVDEGYKWGRIGSSCPKKIKIGDPTPMICAPHLDQDGGLCYEHCESGYNGVAPVCWQICDPDYVDCGVGCAQTSGKCVMTVANQVLAPLMIAANVATFGLADAVDDTINTVRVGSKLVKASSKPGKMMLKAVNALQKIDKGTPVVKKLRKGRIVTHAEKFAPLMKTKLTKFEKALTVVPKVVNGAKKANLFRSTYANSYEVGLSYSYKFVENFADMTSPEIEAMLDANLHPADAFHIKQLWGEVQWEEMRGEFGWTVAQSILSVAELVDRTGILGVVEAYAKPKCHDVVPFPDVY